MWAHFYHLWHRPHHGYTALRVAVAPLDGVEFSRMSGFPAAAVFPCALVPESANVAEVEDANPAVGRPPFVDAAFVADVVVGEEVREEGDF